MIRREIAAALPRVLESSGIDIAALTVTQVETSPNLRNSRIFVSILGHEAERAAMLATLQRHRIEFQEQVSRFLVLKYTPRLSFKLDPSLERGHRVLTLLDGIAEHEHASDADPAADPDNDSEAL